MSWKKRPAPPAVHINRSKRRFEYADGRPFFMIGCNYIGRLQCKYGANNAEEVEADFQRMRRAGINTIRIYAMDRFLSPQGAALLEESRENMGCISCRSSPIIRIAATKRASRNTRATARLFRGDPDAAGLPT